VGGSWAYLGTRTQMHNGQYGNWYEVWKDYTTNGREDGSDFVGMKFKPLSEQQTQGGVAYAGFGTSEALGSLELAIAGLKPTYDAAAYFGRLQGGTGEVPLYLKKNIRKSPLVRGNNALYVGRTSSQAAIRTANVLGKLAPALTVAGVVTNGYDILKDGQLTAGDAFQAANTAVMIAFPVYGVLYGAADLGSSLLFGQSITDYVKSGIDSNVSGSIKLGY